MSDNDVQQSDQDEFGVARAARAARAGTRLGRLVRLLRVVRVLKMFNLVRKNTDKEEMEQQTDEDEDGLPLCAPSVLIVQPSIIKLSGE